MERTFLIEIVVAFSGGARWHLLRASGARRFPGAGDDPRDQHNENRRDSGHECLVAAREHILPCSRYIVSLKVLDDFDVFAAHGAKVGADIVDENREALSPIA